MNKCLIIGHRGAKGLVDHENTIVSYQKAIEIGVDWIELDIHRTLDQQLVCAHDAFVKELPSLRIQDQTYQTLTQVTIKFGYLIPLLKEVLVFCKGKVKLDIELKEEGYEEDVVEMVKEEWSYSDFRIRSFEDHSIKIVKDFDPRVETILLLGVEKPKHGLFTRLSELFPRRRIKKSKADIVSPYYKLIRFGYIKRMHLMKTPVIVWTVNDLEMMRRLLKQRVDGIITDYPNYLKEIIAEKENQHD